jgi:hypothetical protein
VEGFFPSQFQEKKAPECQGTKKNPAYHPLLLYCQNKDLQGKNLHKKGTEN